MTIVRVGTNKKFAQGWEMAFGKGSATATKSAAPKKSKKAPAGKKAKKGAKTRG